MLPNFHQPKRKGEWAEAAFLLQAYRLGFVVARPWGDSALYDFIVHRRRLNRIQVKSAWSKHYHGYIVETIRAKGKCYQRGDFDYLAAYVAALDLWYIIPMKLVAGRHSVVLYPDGSKRAKMQYEPFRNAWHLLR